MGNWLGEETEMKPFMPGAWRVTHGRLFCGVLAACTNLCTDLSWLCAALSPPLWHVERLMISVTEHQPVLLAEGRNVDLSGLFWVQAIWAQAVWTWQPGWKPLALCKAPSWSGRGTETIANPFEIQRAAPPGSSCPLTNLAVAWLSCFVDNLSHHSWLSFSLSLASGCQWWLVWWMNVAPHYIHPWPFWRFLLSTSFFPS